MQKFGIRKGWIDAIETMVSKPVVLMPFIFIAFFEFVALEILSFSARPPVSTVLSPIVRKFFGERFVHYPGDMIILPTLFYYVQVAIYIVAGVFLISISAQIYRNIKQGLPLKADALVKNSIRRYGSYILYGVLIIALMVLARNLSGIVLGKGFRFLARHHLVIAPQVISAVSMITLFVFSFLMQVFLLMAIPIMALQKKSFLRAVGSSVVAGFKNFITLGALFSAPFLLYLPVVILKGYSLIIIGKTFPEMNIVITAAGILLSVFIDCFMILCAAKFLMESEKV